MSPPMPWSIIARAASRATRNEPLAITSCWRSQSLSVVSSSGLEIDSPALLTTRSTPPNASTAGVDRGGHLLGVGDVDGDGDGDVRASDLAPRPWRRSRVDVGDHDARALGGQALGDRPADARSGAGDERDPAGQRPRLRQPLQLGLLEAPVLDAELLRLGDRRVRRDRLGAAHHVDGVDVELGGDPGGLLVGAEREHADAGHEHDRRVGAAHRGASPARRGARSRRGSPRGTPAWSSRSRATASSSGAVGGKVEDERADLGAQEVVGARRAETGQARQLLAGAEVEHRGGIGEVADLHVVGRRQPADDRRQRGSTGPTRIVGERLESGDDRAERLGVAPSGEERLGGADDLERVRLALVARVAPCRDAVAAEDDADRLRVGRAARRRCRGRAGTPGAATAPTRRDRRSTPWSAPRRRWPSPARCRSRDGGGRRGRRRRGRASPCRSTAPRRRVRAGSSRTRRPSRPRARRRDRRRRARAARSRRSTASPSGVSVPRSPPEPFTHSSSTGRSVTGSIASPLADVFPPA